MDARQKFDDFRQALIELHRQRKMMWNQIGISGSARRRFLRGGNVRPDTVRRIGKDVPDLDRALVRRAIDAAELLHRTEVSRGWEHRKTSGVRHSYRFFPKWRHRHYTPGGRWLYRTIKMLWESVLAFQRETRIDPYTTLKSYFFDRQFHPGEAPLRRLADCINRKRQERGESESSINLSMEQLVRRFGCGVSWEAWRKHETRPHLSQPCKICGRLRPDHAVGMRDCAMLARVLECGLPKTGGKFLWALMASVAEIPPRLIAKHTGQAQSAVQAWIADHHRQRAINAIRAQRTTTPGIVLATARVVGLTRTALGEYLHDRAHRPSQQRAVSPRFGKRVAIDRLAAALGIGTAQCLALFERQDFRTQNHIRTIQRQRWHPRRRGRSISRCRDTRAIIRLHAEGKSNADIATQWAAQSADGNTPTEKEIGWIPIQHGRVCVRCRPYVAFDLQARRASVRAIARVLHVGIGTVSRDIGLAKTRMPQFAYGLLQVHDVARLAHLSPDAIRWHETRGHLTATRTASGWRQFRQDDVDRFLQQRNADLFTRGVER